MRLIIAAVGRLKDGPERALCARYKERLDMAGRKIGLGPVSFCEVPEGRAGRAEERRADEAARLAKAAGRADLSIALDQQGKAMTSEAFASFLAGKRDGGTKTAALFIGGPDGHGGAIIDSADLKLSLGGMTLPHGLARIILIEQIYRAAMILAGHPYHRA